MAVRVHGSEASLIPDHNRGRAAVIGKLHLEVCIDFPAESLCAAAAVFPRAIESLLLLGGEGSWKFSIRLHILLPNQTNRKLRERPADGIS